MCCDGLHRADFQRGGATAGADSAGVNVDVIFRVASCVRSRFLTVRGRAATFGIVSSGVQQEHVAKARVRPFAKGFPG